MEIQVVLLSLGVNVVELPSCMNLYDPEGNRFLSVPISYDQAMSIAEVQLRTNHRPITPDVICSILRELGATVERMVIRGTIRSPDQGSPTFLASLFVDQNGKEVEFDCRPSDAIALAVRLNFPIFIVNEVLDEFGRTLTIGRETPSGEHILPEQLGPFKDVISQLDI